MFKKIRREDEAQERRPDAPREPESTEGKSDLTLMIEELLKKEQEDGP